MGVMAEADPAMYRAMGETLKGLRDKRAMRVCELARRSTVHRNQLALYESGEVMPTLPMLMQIAEACGTTASAILRNAELRMAKGETR